VRATKACGTRGEIQLVPTTLTTAAIPDGRARRQWGVTLRMPGASSTWPAMCGSGWPIATTLSTNRRARKSPNLLITRQDLNCPGCGSCVVVRGSTIQDICASRVVFGATLTAGAASSGFVVRGRQSRDPMSLRFISCFLDAGHQVIRCHFLWVVSGDLLSKGPVSSRHHTEVRIARVLLDQQFEDLSDMRDASFARTRRSMTNPIGLRTLAVSRSVRPVVVIENQPAVLCEKFVDKEECRPVDGPVLRAVDDAEVVNRLASTLVRLRRALGTQFGFVLRFVFGSFLTCPRLFSTTWWLRS